MGLRELKFLILIQLFTPALVFGILPPLPNELDHEFGYFEEKSILNEDKFDLSTGVKTDLEPVIRSLIPSYYQIKIRPLFDPIESPEKRFTVPGSVVVWVDCLEPTNAITLNAREITVVENSVKVISRESFTEIRVISQRADTEESTYTIQLDESLKSGQGYEVRLDYVAKVFRDRMNGLYLSYYTDPVANVTKYLATTQFEPYGARQLFPCFDQPDLKAIFDLSVGRRENYNSLSNMDVYKTEPIENEEGWFWDHYNSTVKMSSYLIAVIVSEFKSESADSAIWEKPVKIWGPAHKIDRKDGVFAAKTVATILKFYEEYFQVKYPLPKMDSAEIPHFESGAMENYGLNTYRNNYLLYYPEESTESARYTIATVVAHELAHQWFGDLVTTRTWPHIWLNEGFASYVEVLGTEAAYPEFETWKLFVPSTFQVALQYDQSPASHPIVDVTYNKGRFDKITYQKGASLIRMMRGFLGEEALKAGLQNYLKKFSFGNAFQSDLFDTLQETAQEFGLGNYISVREIMESWTLQKGYPLVRVFLAQEPDKIYLTQERFIEGNLPKQSAKKELEPGSELWWVPINLVTKSSPEIKKSKADFWIPRNIGIYLKSDVDTSDLVIANPDAVGYYRVYYDDVLRQRIKAQLDSNPDILTPNKRSQLLDDYFNFAWSHYITIDKPLEFTTYLGKETELSVWTTTFRHLLKTYYLFSSTPAYQSFRDYLLPKVDEALKTIGIENKVGEKGAPVFLRSRLTDWACSFESERCTQYAIRVFKNWVAAPKENPVPIEVRSTLLCSAIAGLGESAWNTAYEKFAVKKQSSIYRFPLLRALSCSKSENVLNRLLEKSIQPDSGIAKSEVAPLLQYVLSNPIGRQLGRKFLRGRLAEIVDYLGEDSKSLVAILDSLARYLYKEEDINSFQAFTAQHSLGLESYQSRINATVAAIKQNKAWMDKFYEPMQVWFHQQLQRETFNSKSL